MASGRKPKPTEAKRITGNPGKRPLNGSEPQPRRAVPTCPEWLDDEARAKWGHLVPELERLRLLTVVDGDALACYCQAWAEFLKATETLKREGRYTKRGTGGLASHPAVSQQRTAWKAVRDFAALFGLDPSSRSRLQVPEPDAEADALESFLGGAG